VIEAYVIDDMNILQASLMAMRDAVLELSLPPDYLLIDGRHKIPLIIPQETIIQGDSRSLSIAAASIIAKVSRDRIMEIYHRQFPQYNFLKNKGYGTREHLRLPLRFNGENLEIAPMPDPGQHNEEIYGLLGIGVEDLKQFKKKHVI